MRSVGWLFIGAGFLVSAAAVTVLLGGLALQVLAWLSGA